MRSREFAQNIENDPWWRSQERLRQYISQKNPKTPQFEYPRQRVQRGRCVYWNASIGAGIIQGQDGNKLMVSYQDVVKPGHRNLEPGESVTYTPEQTDRGFLRAKRVTPL